jgi:hypothetical protein
MAQPTSGAETCFCAHPNLTTLGSMQRSVRDRVGDVL